MQYIFIINSRARACFFCIFYKKHTNASEYETVFSSQPPKDNLPEMLRKRKIPKNTASTFAVPAVLPFQIYRFMRLMLVSSKSIMF